MLLPCKVKSVKNTPSRPVVPYAKYRVVKNSRKTTRSFFAVMNVVIDSVFCIAFYHNNTSI
ncbi:uncharacterized protein [Blastocystis hominis]|uniref:Uncharacterized protein n=1 Tax=Blastocystis hominis TaxID=12968 RepID=D8LXQ4_BLAHO|nr:uncharacterized protein [Blastocystis hominis]CBK20359.2 unnamed protein product [Blastocystis hominis]|eukprot:XP_012894407.1 uncharacterized protein [Blastocystis hominis]